MLTGALVDWSAMVPGGVGGLSEDLARKRWRGNEVELPKRAPEVPAGRWRRMSRFARLTTLAVLELKQRNPDVDWARLPMVQGSAMGEVVPSSDFLDRWFTEGPENASPSNFQNSVYNATGAHLSLVFGMRGPAETVSCGMATGLAALARGLEWVDRAPHVLVVAGDDVNRTTTKALRATGTAADVVVACLVKAGTGLTLVDGPGEAEITRGVAMPYEPEFTPRPGLHPEAVLGINCASGLLFHLATGRSTLDEDDGACVRALAGEGGGQDASC